MLKKTNNIVLKCLLMNNYHLSHRDNLISLSQRRGIDEQWSLEDYSDYFRLKCQIGTDNFYLSHSNDILSLTQETGPGIHWFMQNKGSGHYSFKVKNDETSLHLSSYGNKACLHNNHGESTELWFKEYP